MNNIKNSDLNFIILYNLRNYYLSDLSLFQIYVSVIFNLLKNLSENIFQNVNRNLFI